MKKQIFNPKATQKAFSDIRTETGERITRGELVKKERMMLEFLQQERELSPEYDEIYIS